MKRQLNKDNLRIQKEAIGKMAELVLDLVKLIFAGVIVAGILDLSANKLLLVISGGVICVFLLILWYLLFYRSKRKG